MGVDRHRETFIGRLNTETDRYLPKVEAAGSSPVSRLDNHFEYGTVGFGPDRISLGYGRNSLKVELIPFFQSVCQRIDRRDGRRELLACHGPDE